MIENVIYALCLSGLMKLAFSPRIKKNTKIQSFLQILPVGAELFRADGGTDEVSSRFLQFCERT